jgi:NADH-quinone oxidoreductase subunit N
VNATDIPAPSIAYGPLWPMLAVFLAATVGVLVEAFAPPRWRRPLQLGVAMAGLVGGLVAIALVAGKAHPTLIAQSAVAVDGPTLFIQGTLLVLGIAAILLLGERGLDSTGGAFVAAAAVVPGTAGERALTASRTMQTEVFPLTMFAIGGMLLFPASNNLLLMFVALEILSLPLYLLAGLARRRRLLSQEAAVKYFLLGAFSSAFFLYGIAMLYGYAGSVDLGAILTATGTVGANDTLLYLGIALLSVGLLFKIGAAPFHNWTPDVYQGAPTPVTALMASGTKVAAFGALLRVFYVAFAPARWDWRPLMWGVAILTMAVGAVLAITQTDVKRMLAYSSIAHTGFILTGLVALNRSGLSGSLFYLLTYGFSTLGAFAIVTLVRNADGEATHLSQWRGLGRRAPLLAGIFTFFLLAFAGIPVTSGFVSKFAVFSAAISGGATALVVVGLIASAVAAAFYFRVIVLMFFEQPAPDGPTIAVPSAMTYGAIAFAFAVTLVLGVVPGPLLTLADKAALFVR